MPFSPLESSVCGIRSPPVTSPRAFLRHATPDKDIYVAPFGKYLASKGSRLAIQPDERADEEAEALRLFLRTGDLVGASSSAFRQDALQFREVGRRQRFVQDHLADRDVVLMGAQERARLRAELLEVGADSEPGELYVGRGSDLILEIRVNEPSLPLIDECDQVP